MLFSIWSSGILHFFALKNKVFVVYTLQCTIVQIGGSVSGKQFAERSPDPPVPAPSHPLPAIHPYPSPDAPLIIVILFYFVLTEIQQ